jgi:hypothetical protein
MPSATGTRQATRRLRSATTDLAAAVLQVLLVSLATEGRPSPPSCCSGRRLVGGREPVKVARHAARRGAPDAPRRHAVLVLEFFDAWAVLISCEARALTEGSNQPNRYSIGFKSVSEPLSTKCHRARHTREFPASADDRTRGNPIPVDPSRGISPEMLLVSSLKCLILKASHLLNIIRFVGALINSNCYCQFARNLTSLLKCCSPVV